MRAEKHLRAFLLLLSLFSFNTLHAQQEKKSTIIDVARILHSEELEEMTLRLQAIEEKTSVPITLKILVSKTEYPKAVEHWNSLPAPAKGTPLCVLALVDYSSSPQVVLRFRTSKADIDTQEVRKFFNLIEESASSTTNPKASVQILLDQLEDEIPFILNRAKGKKKQTKVVNSLQKDHRKKEALRWLLPALVFLALLALLLLAYFLYSLYRKKRPVHLPEPLWNPRLGAPYSGGNNALSQPRKPTN